MFGRDAIVINTDVMPAVAPVTAHSKVSWKATIAERELLKQDAIERLAKHEPGTILDDILDQLWLERF
jgi:hypothetical protein